MRTGTPTVPAKRLLQPALASSGLIKGQASDTPAPGLVPAFSASGQDVWVPSTVRYETRQGIVLSAVGAQCGKVFFANYSEWSTVANTYAWTFSNISHPKFVWYLLSTDNFWHKGGAAQPYVKIPESLNKHVFCPVWDDQKKIADYLDHETAEIDALIEDLTLLSITVREFFEASLNQQTNQPWQTGASDDKVIPLTRALPERVDYRGATPLKTVSGTQLVTARNVRQGWIDYKTNQEFVDTNEYYSIMSRGIPKLGDILFTMEAPLGNVALVDRTDIALAQRIIKFSAADFVQPKFILYAIMSQSFQSQLLTLASGSTALGLKASKLNQLKVRVPSIGSQRKIVEEIELLFNRSVGVRRDIERAVEVARERRAALITAAVTGQIDVTAKNKSAAEQLEDDIAQGLHRES